MEKVHFRGYLLRVSLICSFLFVIIFVLFKFVKKIFSFVIFFLFFSFIVLEFFNFFYALILYSLLRYTNFSVFLLSKLLWYSDFIIRPLPKHEKFFGCEKNSNLLVTSAICGHSALEEHSNSTNMHNLNFYL